MTKISEEELDRMAQFLQDKSRKRRERLHSLFLKANRDFDRIVQMIVEKYQPKKIYQWGSLLNERNFNENSDIDLAIEGLASPQEFFAILGDAEELTSFPVDLVEIEKIHPTHAESIKKEGKLVYARK